MHCNCISGDKKYKILENTFFLGGIYFCWNESNFPKFRQDFFWMEIYWQDFCRLIYYSGENLFCLRRIDFGQKLIGSSLRTFCSYFFFFIFCPIWKIFFQDVHSNPKCNKNTWYLTNILIQFLNILGSGAAALLYEIQPWLWTTNLRMHSQGTSQMKTLDFGQWARRWRNIENNETFKIL